MTAVSSVTWDSSTDIPKVVKDWELKMQDQVFKECPFIDQKHITKFTKGQVHGTVIIKAGGNGSAGFIADGGTRTYGGVEPNKVHYYPALLVAGLEIGRLAAKMTKDVDEGIDMVVDGLETMTDDLGRQLGRAVFNTQLGNPTAAVTADTSSSVTVDDPTGFEIGMQFDVYNDSAVFVETVTVTNVTYPDDPDNDATVSFTGGGSNNTAANSWTASPQFTFWMKGAAASSGNGGISLTDASSETATLMTQAVTGYNWHGQQDTSTTTLSLTAMENLFVQSVRRAKSKPTCIVGNSVNEARYAALNNSQIRYKGSDSLDARGAGNLEYRGSEFVVDEQCPDKQIHYFNKKSVKLHMFCGLEPDARDKRGNPKMELTEGSHTWKIPFSLAYNLQVLNRSRLAAFTALTA